MASWHDFDVAAERRDASAGLEYERAWEEELDRRAEEECEYGEQSVVLHHLGSTLDMSPENLQPLSRACHRGDHAKCEHHKPGQSHECQCSCHLSTQRG